MEDKGIVYLLFSSDPDGWKILKLQRMAEVKRTYDNPTRLTYNSTIKGLYTDCLVQTQMHKNSKTSENGFSQEKMQ